MADQTDPIAQQLAEKLARLEAEIAERVHERDRCRAALQALEGLQMSKQSVSVKSNMLQTHRVHHSRGRSHDSLTLYANEAHHSIRSLAKAAGCSAPLLTQARDGTCSISRALALKVQSLTKSATYPKGFEATAANWPKIRQD